MNLHDILLKKHTSENLPLENFVYRQADAIPFCPAMWHEELFVSKMLSGSCTLFANGAKLAISQGDIVVLPPFTLYTLQNQQDVVIDCLLVNLRALQNNKNTLTYPGIQHGLRCNTTGRKIPTNWPSDCANLSGQRPCTHVLD